MRVGSDAGAQTKTQSWEALPCVGCLNRCLWAAALHSSHSQGFVLDMKGLSRGREVCKLRLLCSQKLNSLNLFEQPVD